MIEQQYALETASAKALAERQRLETQATLELLKKEQEVAEAEAEVSVLRSFDGEEQSKSQTSVSSLPESDSRTKTKDYIETLQQPNVHYSQKKNESEFPVDMHINNLTWYVLHNYKVSRNSIEWFQRSGADEKNRTGGLTDGLGKNIIPSATCCSNIP